MSEFARRLVRDALAKNGMSDDEIKRQAQIRATGATEWPEEVRGDAWEPPPGHQESEPGPRKQPKFRLINSAEFAAAEYKLDWLVKRLLVRGQPVIVGGPKKALKTSLLVDLALSFGAGVPFLGQFETRPSKVAILSGESGQGTLQETARRVAAAKNVNLADCDVFWGFDLPQLTVDNDLLELKGVLQAEGVEVFILDPFYLSVISGAGRSIQHSNLFDMGPLLMGITRACVEIGCTPIIAHHFRLNRADHHSEPQLEDLAFAGIQEFARQWLLVGRREKYEGGGSHRLWLSVGGSAGQSGCWALDVNEGTIADDFSGRSWETFLMSASEERQSQMEVRNREKRERKELEEQETENALLKALDDLDPEMRGAGYNAVKSVSGLSHLKMEQAFFRLRKGGIVQECTVSIQVGNRATRPSKGIKRVH